MQLGAQIAALGVFVAGLAALAVWVARRKRGTPEKRERQRRLLLHQRGRIGDALILEVTQDAFYYTYSVGGVQYEASQDISALRDRLPAEPERLIGWSGMKYSSNNPANSMLICEEWSGLRGPARSNSARPDSVSGAESVDSAESVDRDGIGHQGQDAALAESALHQGTDGKIAE